RDEIALANRGAADGQEDVGGFAGAGERRETFNIVFRNAEPHGLAALGLDQGGEPIRDRGDDLVWTKFRAGGHYLIACGEDRHLRLAANRDLGKVHRRGQDELAGTKPRAGKEQYLSFPKILPAWADMLARTGFLDGHDAVSLLGILLDHDRVCAFRHRRSGKDAHGLALTDALLEA